MDSEYYERKAREEDKKASDASTKRATAEARRAKAEAAAHKAEEAASKTKSESSRKSRLRDAARRRVDATGAGKEIARHANAAAKAQAKAAGHRRQAATKRKREQKDVERRSAAAARKEQREVTQARRPVAPADQVQEGRPRLIAYLDTCIVSGLAKEDLAQREQDAIADLLEHRKDGHVELVTSSVTAEEIARIPVEARRRHRTIYALLQDIPASRAQWTDGGLALTGVGGGRRLDPLYAELLELLPDERDAQHLFQAIKSGVPYFVTTDARTILRFAPELKENYGIDALLPSQLPDQL